MFNRCLVVALVIGIVTPSLSAQTAVISPSSGSGQPMAEQARAKAATLAKSQGTRPSSTQNARPYETAGIVMMSAGAGLTLLAFANPTGASCTSTATNTSSTFSCGTHANKGLVFAGLGSIGVGVYLFGKKAGSPQIGFTPHSIFVTKKF